MSNITPEAAARVRKFVQQATQLVDARYRSLAPPTGYAHPTTIQEFESIYRKEYDQEIESCDRWIIWCQRQNVPDTHGINFHQGRRSALVFNDIKMHQLLRVLKQEPPNCQ